MTGGTGMLPAVEKHDALSFPVESVAQGSLEISIQQVRGAAVALVADHVADEEPLEIQLEFSERPGESKSIAVTMRTPGNDAELALGFLLTEGVLRDTDDVLAIHVGDHVRDIAHGNDTRSVGNVVRVVLAPGVEVDAGRLQRNFYTTSSCGVCGKASLLALRTVCPPRAPDNFAIHANNLKALPDRLRAEQIVFGSTGGLHAAALFDSSGSLTAIREDVGRHNAVDKLIGTAAKQEELPLIDRGLMLSGRASFELLQKALMGGVRLVASVGAPSSMAVAVAREFDITLIGFLREDRFNIYHGARRISGISHSA